MNKIMNINEQRIRTIVCAMNDEGFVPEDDELNVLYEKACELIMESTEPVLEQCDLETSGDAQFYEYVDQAGAQFGQTGEIFDFPHAKAEDGVYFTPDEDAGGFRAIDWQDAKAGDIFVYAHIVTLCPRMGGGDDYEHVALYDYIK